MSWDDLLGRPMVVILGDAGSGKSTELFQQKQRLEKQGDRAFFASMNEIGQTDPNVLFGSADLQEWLASDDPAHFFLDAIDEARLQRLNLEHVLRAFLQRLGTGRGAVYLVLSCRPADWRGEDDARALTSLLRSPDSQAEPPLVVSMVGLDWERARRLISHYGVADPEPIRRALETDGREFLLENPRDVHLIADWWTKYRSVGSFFDMLDAATAARLSGPPGRGAHITPEEARQGAMTLAAISVLANEVRIDAMLDDLSVTGVDPRLALSDWSEDEIRDLLGRGGFVPEATCVRVFHRSAHELLAAQWFLQKLQQGVSSSVVHRILLTRAPDWSSMLRPTASWVAARDQHLAHTLEKVDPASLILFGDPGSLTVARRESALRATLAGQVPEFIEDDVLRRFWHPDLCAVLVEVASGALSDAAAALVCRLGAVGNVQEIAPLACDLALDDEAPRNLRVDAIRALAALRAHESELTALAARIRDEQDLLGPIVEATFPEHLTLGDLSTIFERATLSVGEGISVLSMAICQRLPRVSSEERTSWLESASRAAAPSTNTEWLMLAVADSLKEEKFEPALSALCDFLARNGAAEVRHSSRKLASSWPALRRALFWRRVASHRATRTERPLRRIWQVEFFGSDPRLKPDDKVWLAEDSAGRNDVVERLLAFDALTPLCTDDEIASIAARDEALGKRFERSRNPQRSVELEVMDSEHRRRERLIERRVARAREQLMQLVPEIAGGRHVNALLHLLEVAGRHDAAPDLAKVEERYGATLAEAFSQGLRAYGRTANVPRVYERGANNGIPYEVALAEAAVHHEVALTRGLPSLSDAAAARVVRIALWMSNRVPDWVARVAAEHPCVVHEVAPVLRAEIALSQGDHSFNVFHKISRAAVELRHACYATIEELLLTTSSIRADVLEGALKAAFAAPQAKLQVIGQQIAPLVNQTGEMDTVVVALCGWLHVEPTAAASWLSSNVAGVPDAATLVIRICDRLKWWLDERSPFEHRLRTSVPAIASLLPVLFFYVDPEQDLPIQGFIGDRQSAQMLRDTLFRLLESTPLYDSEVVIRALIGHPTMQAVRARLEARVLRSKWEALTMTAAQATKWAQSLVDTPTNATQLFELACARLEDIRSELEDGEFGYGDALVPNSAASSGRTDEYRFQRWLAAQLKMLAGQAYAVVREPEAKDKKRPDIRLEKAGLTPTSIELKVAESWSLEELCSALEHQLCGQYLRNVHSRHGILVVCSARHKVWNGGKRLPEVVATLRTLAAELAARTGYELSVVVYRFWDL